MEVSQKTKKRTTILPSNSTPGYIFLKKGTETLIQKDRCTPMFPAALFKIAKIWKQSKCPSTDGERKCSVNIYSGHKKTMKCCHLQHHGWTWRTLCCEISQTEKANTT